MSKVVIEHESALDTFEKRVEYVSANRVIFGLAQLGSSESAAVWRIWLEEAGSSPGYNKGQKIFASGSDAFDFVWNDRATYFSTALSGGFDALPYISGGVGIGVPVYALRLDEVGSVTYVGEASPGTLTSAASWRIKRLTETGPDLTIQFADGNSSFDNIWDNRLALSYS